MDKEPKAALLFSHPCESSSPSVMFCWMPERLRARVFFPSVACLVIPDGVQALDRRVGLHRCATELFMSTSWLGSQAALCSFSARTATICTLSTPYMHRVLSFALATTFSSFMDTQHRCHHTHEAALCAQLERCDPCPAPTIPTYPYSMRQG